jgi:undecaprenyl-diphosphatase
VRPIWIAVAVAVAGYVVARRRTMGRVEQVVLAVVAAAAGAYGLGLFKLPNVEHTILKLGEALGSWTYLLVGVMAFLETGAFVGLIAPGETFILVGGVVAGQGQISVVVLIGIVWAAAVAGDLSSFYLGRRLGRDFMERHGPRFKITPQRIDQVERFYGRHGGKAVFLGRFVGVIRAISPFIAGSTRMPLSRFLPYDILGAGLWGSALCVLGYLGWRSFDKIAGYASKGFLALGTVIVVVGGGIAAFRWLREPENREKAHTWLHERAERPALRPLAKVVRPVFWRVIVPAVRFAGGPVRFVEDRLTPGQLGLELTTLLAVGAVGSYTFFALAAEVGSGGPTSMDRSAFDLAADLRSRAVVDVAKALSILGSAGFLLWLIVAVTVVLLAMRRPLEAGTLVSGGVLTYAAVHVAKAVVDRPRPPGGLVHASLSAYPSGHAAYSMAWVAVAVALWHAVPALAGRAALIVGAMVLAAAIGLSRVMLHVHYLSDVFGGWGLGAACFSLCGCVALVIDAVRHTRAP